MLSAVAKAYLVLAVVVSAFTIGYLDPLSLGAGGGGDHFGGTLLVTTIIGALAFAVVTSLRPVADSDIEAPTPADAPPPSVRPVNPEPTAGASVFPLLAAVGLALVGVAAATGAPVFYLALGVLVLAAAGWLSQAFVEHPLVTRRLAERVSQRTTSPFTYPALAVLLGAVVALSISRLYITISETAAIIVSGVVATVLFLGCLIVANGRNVSRRLTAGLAGLALVSVVGAGAASAARGERTIEHHADPDITREFVRAEGIEFDKDELALTEGLIRFTFENNDPKGTFHNIGFYSEREAGKPYIAFLPLNGGERASTVIDIKQAGLTAGGSYWFRCDFHPGMVGTVRVEQAPPKAEHGAESERKVEKH